MRPRRTPPGETSPDVAQELADELLARLLAAMLTRPEERLYFIALDLSDDRSLTLRTYPSGRWTCGRHSHGAPFAQHHGVDGPTRRKLAATVRKLLP